MQYHALLVTKGRGDYNDELIQIKGEADAKDLEDVQFAFINSRYTIEVKPGL